MRVLIVTQYFWPEQFRINDLALGLRDRGHEVTVYTGKPNYPGGSFFVGYGFFGRAAEDYQGVRVIRVPLVPRGAGTGIRLSVNYLSFAFIASVLAPLRCRGRYDIILGYEPSPITVALPALVLRRLKRAPFMFWVQDLWPESLSATGAVQTPWILKLVEHLVRNIYRGCDRILVQSRSFIPAVARFVSNPQQILYFPNSAEDLYQPVAVESAYAECRDLPTGFLVMFAGNIGAAQDFETILNAAERLKSHSAIKWVVIGDGRRLAWVSAEVTRRGLQDTVHLLGRRPVELMPNFFALADAMLVTLKKNPIFALTIPAKVQSYLACARPIVAALDGEGEQIIHEAQAGIAVEAENPQALADAILTLYRMPTAERVAMGQRGREYFEAHFERGLLLNQLERWMQELLGERNADSHTRR